VSAIDDTPSDRPCEQRPRIARLELLSLPLPQRMFGFIVERHIDRTE